MSRTFDRMTINIVKMANSIRLEIAKIRKSLKMLIFAVFIYGTDIALI